MQWKLPSMSCHILRRTMVTPFYVLRRPDTCHYHPAISCDTLTSVMTTRYYVGSRAIYIGLENTLPATVYLHIALCLCFSLASDSLKNLYLRYCIGTFPWHRPRPRKRCSLKPLLATLYWHIAICIGLGLASDAPNNLYLRHCTGTFP